MSTVAELREEYRTTRERFLNGRPHLHARVTELRKALEAAEAAEAPVDTLTLRPSASLKAASREYVPEPWSPAETTTAEALPPAPSQARSEGSFYTAPNTYGHSVRFWARDAEHAAFVAKRAHLRADAVEPEVPVVAQAAPRLAELERLEARYAEIEAANRRLNESIRHLSARVTAANTLADVVATTAAELEAITSGRDDKRVSRRARALGLAVASYRAAGPAPTSSAAFDAAVRAVAAAHTPDHDREGYAECSCGWSSWTVPESETVLTHILADLRDRLGA